MGAIRHVVGSMQMKVINRAEFGSPLTILDLWVSMIENWGEANKEYAHCGNLPVGKCLVKMGKYLARMFNAMRLVRARAGGLKERLVSFGGFDPEFTSLEFLKCRREGSAPQKACAVAFLKTFGCTEADNYDENPPLSADCLSLINAAVDAYNKRLATLVTDKDGREV